MRSKFDQQLEVLHTELISMGALCENLIATSAQALITNDIPLAKTVATKGEEVDLKERDIENLCMKLLLQQQPVAKDLRLISSALKMITDMERIGDQAEDIAQIICSNGSLNRHNTAPVREMAQATTAMVTQSIDAFVRSDLEIAHKVIADDDIVDECFARIKSQLVNSFHKEGQEGESALDLLMIAKYFERIGDHATNIAEWVVFSITGSHKLET
ncbi:MAG: phosphate signaling complex protein PhoU [Eubacteriales bacterium]